MPGECAARHGGFARVAFVVILGLTAAAAAGVFALEATAPALPQTDQPPVATSSSATTSPQPATSQPTVRSSLPPRALTYATHTVPISAADVTASFRLAEPFRLSVAAEGLGKARFMVRSPDGRIFVPDLVDYRLSREGKLYILDDFNPRTGRFETKQLYAENLRGPNSVAFYTDEEGQTWLYLALTAELRRYPYRAGDVRPSGDYEVVATFPNEQAKSAQSVVWHITRTIAIRDGRLYVSVGSGCNSCEEAEGKWRAALYSMRPDGSDRRMVARGLRNAVGFTWAALPHATGTTLVVTENGADHLGVRAPNDVLFTVPDTAPHFGWPYCYFKDGRRVPDTTQVWQRSFACDEAPPALATFPPRSAPLGVHYFDGSAPPELRNSFLVALHGSFDPLVGNGYRIVRVTPEGEIATFMDGFLSRAGGTPVRYGRPVAFLPYDDDSFFFTDDYHGRVYWVHRQPTATSTRKGTREALE